jgi:hypothetical protein
MAEVTRGVALQAGAEMVALVAMIGQAARVAAAAAEVSVALAAEAQGVVQQEAVAAAQVVELQAAGAVGQSEVALQTQEAALVGELVAWASLKLQLLVGLARGPLGVEEGVVALAAHPLVALWARVGGLMAQECLRHEVLAAT